MTEQYFKNILKVFKSGDTTEESFYGVFSNFIEDFAKSKRITLTATANPKKRIAGKPDFIIRKGKQLVGYIEAKNIGKNLEMVENDEQIERYKKNFDNFILTNYFDFWLWRRSENKWIIKVSLCKGPKLVLQSNQTPPIVDEKLFFDLLLTFFKFNIPERKTAKQLAEELAIKTRLIPQPIIDELNNDIETEIDRIYEAFRNYLISDLSKEDFADIYAQTITYGLFMARLRHKEGEFNRFTAQKYIPKSIHVLRDTFSLISGQNLPESLDWVVDDIATILANADIEKIRKELHTRTGGDDPMVHFYETFLKQYNPKEKKHRGVFYTPLPVVSYITRSINTLLKEKFNKKEGFADKSVILLDPASGTLTFPANAINIAKEEIDKSSTAGSWLQVVKNHILKNYYAFELLMAPYVIGHLKISLLLESLGYKFKDDDRFPLYLTNTLDLSEVEQTTLPYVAGLSEEAEKANQVKKKTPILVIMGNPPYSVSSSNIIKEESGFKELYESYKETVRKEEKNIQPLSDDYIKFIAFAHWKIKQTGQGIIGMITNNSYLDGLIHRDMRRKLSEDFDEIYILNLHGSLKRKEKTPDDKKDENVFDIQQGVSVILLVKRSGKQKSVVEYSDIWGLREAKYRFLETHDIKNTKWEKLEPKKPRYFFILKDFSSIGNYQSFLSLKDIFLKSTSGVKTHRDNFVLDFSKENLRRRLSMFCDNHLEDEQFELKDTGTWKIKRARAELVKSGIKEELFKQYNYRPFDIRWIYQDKNLIDRMRSEDIWNLDGNNLALITTKQLSTSFFRHCFVSQFPADICSISLQTKESSYVFPLYLYTKEQIQRDIFDGGIEQTNFNLDIINLLEKSYNKKLVIKGDLNGFFACDIFCYIYAILYSIVYREKYNEFLKIDFPRIPFTKDYKLFQKVAKLGEQLISLHLLKSEKLKKSIAKFPVSTGNILTDGRLEKREHNEKEKRIYINDKQYFEKIEPEIWNYYIGGYQVLDKWLKDRIGEKLQPEDINHYLKIITTVKHSIDLQKQIDKLYPEVDKTLI